MLKALHKLIPRNHFVVKPKTTEKKEEKLSIFIVFSLIYTTNDYDDDDVWKRIKISKHIFECSKAFATRVYEADVSKLHHSATVKNYAMKKRKKCVSIDGCVCE